MATASDGTWEAATLTVSATTLPVRASHSRLSGSEQGGASLASTFTSSFLGQAHSTAPHADPQCLPQPLPALPGPKSRSHGIPPLPPLPTGKGMTAGPQPPTVALQDHFSAFPPPSPLLQMHSGTGEGRGLILAASAASFLGKVLL
ncbi:hypothetical protein P7K49_011895, partial [Saguinus oedipus]